ncbi:hypothetical protein [Luteibacter sp.]|jgi:hypothetical protein|uniref:hypothetical protein n=1 Tax=Luteibacter sp. TaxID=1886636 RepID=UPI002F3E4727
MKFKASTFQSAADVKQGKREALREREELAIIVNSMNSRTDPYELVDIDPEIAVALDIIGNDDQPDGAKKVLPVALLDQTITISCPKIANASDDDQAYAFLVTKGDDPEEPADIIAFSDIVNSVDFPADLEMDFDVSQLGITAGQNVEYDLYVGQGSDISNPYISNVYRIRFDARVPGNVPDFSHVLLPDEYIDNGVTRAQIIADGGFMATIQAYFGHEPDDETSLVFTTIPGGEVYEYATGRIPEPAHVLPVQVPLEFFEDNDIDVRVSIALKARDVAGNENTGQAHEVNLLIASSPSALQALEVPLHDDDTLPLLIDLADSRTPPSYIVPYYDAPVAGDLLRVKINGDILLNTVPAIVGAPGDDVATGPIPTDLIVSLGSGTDGRFTFAIDYDLLRNGFTIPASLPRTIAVDLRASGWETELLPGSIRGPNSLVDNDIVPADSTGPLTGTIPHLALDGSEAFETNDRVTLYKVNMDGTGPVTIGPPRSAIAGSDLAYPVDAGALVDGSNYVRYDNFRAHTGGATNTELSPIWLVTVAASTGLPGGGNPIPFNHWLFRDARQRIVSPGIIQPSMNLRRARGNTNDGTRFSGVIVRIHHYANMAAGDSIVVTVDGYDNRTGTGTPAFTEALPPYLVTDFDAGGTKVTAIPEDALNGNELPPFAEEPPPANEEKRFADIVIPYDPIIRMLNADGNIGRGSIRVRFAIANDVGSGVSDAVNTLFLDVDARTAT